MFFSLRFTLYLTTHRFRSFASRCTGHHCLPWPGYPNTVILDQRTAGSDASLLRRPHYGWYLLTVLVSDCCTWLCLSGFICFIWAPYCLLFHPSNSHPLSVKNHEWNRYRKLQRVRNRESRNVYHVARVCKQWHITNIILIPTLPSVLSSLFTTNPSIWWMPILSLPVGDIEPLNHYRGASE